MKMKKSITAILMTTMILLSFLGTILLVQNVGADVPTYHIKNGVLSSDDYSLYPYANKSLDMGMSKYGEMISETAGGVSVGLQYPGYEVVGTYDQNNGTSRDPFANDAISKKLWLNGWLMEIRYTHRTLRDRTILAMAMFGDMAGYGGDWLNGFNASKLNGLAAAPHGGRKCTGYAVTDPVAQLYDGPRSCISLSVTHIFDWTDDNGNGVVDYPAETWPVLDLRITFIFDKVKKEVIILKDVKLLMSGKELGSPVDVQFGDREEWDLGPAPEWPSYAHFYTDQLTTSYGPDWNMATGILREYQYKGPGDIAGVAMADSRDPYGPPIAAGSVRVYVNGAFKEEGSDYTINYDTGAITWHIGAPTHTDLLEVIYKLYKYTDMRLVERLTGVPNLYDVAQIISADTDVDGNLAPQYVGWKAFWPVLSDYTVDGWVDSLTPLINVSQPDFLTKSPDIPFIIGEWDFLLGKGYPVQFRGVEVVGITDYHDAFDTHMAPEAPEPPNILDREAMYQLNEVFNPWDLLQAVEKKNARWVDFTDYIDVAVDANWTTTFGSTGAPVIVSPYRPWYIDATYPAGYVQLNGGTGNDWMPNPTEWDQYGTFSERIENLTNGQLLQRYWDYDIVLLPDGQAKITFYYSGYYKILYSTSGPNSGIDDGKMPIVGERYEWITVGRDASSVDSAGAALVAAAIKDKGVEIGLGGLDMKSATYNVLIPYLLNKFGTGDTFQNYFLAPDHSSPGQRLAFMDDWCTYWPIASSDMIAVGGPLANQITMYYNDFVNAFYGTPWFTPYAPWSGKIVAPTCWAKNAYANSGGQNGTGYATIGTYLDINGTVGFDIWGLDGRDTYYATYWLNGDPARGIPPGIVQLQDAPLGLTSIILKINYVDSKHPVFSIVECLGTISETKWVHGLEIKGGLHDP
jgi:hypothetical protein